MDTKEYDYVVTIKPNNATKEYDYVVTIKSNNVLIVNTVSVLLLAIAFFVIMYIGFHILSVSPKMAWISFAVAGFAFVWTLIRYVAIKKPYYRLALLVAAVYFFFFRFEYSWVFGLLYLVAGLLEKPAKMPAEFGFDKNGITPNALIPKFYPWSDLQNVLIKDNLLTIDFKNNKLYQKEIQNPVSKEMEMEFNVFCKECLTQKNNQL